MKKPVQRKPPTYPKPVPERPAIADLVDKLREQIRTHERASQRFAREKARRTDQYKALLQVANLLLVVASNEIVRTESDYAD